MEYHRNLNGHFIKPKNSFIFGIAVISIGVIYFAASFVNTGFRWPNFLLSLVFVINGIVLLMRSKGWLIFNKSYIHINDESLSISVVAQKKTVLWKDVDSIDISNDMLRITPLNKNFQYVSFKPLEREMVDEIMNELVKVAKLKKISIIK